MIYFLKITLFVYFSIELYFFRTNNNLISLLCCCLLSVYIYFLNDKKPSTETAKRKLVIYSHTFLPVTTSLFEFRLTPLAILLIVFSVTLALVSTINLNRFFHAEPFQHEFIQQKGIYSIVRHPIYLSGSLIFLTFLVSANGDYNIILSIIFLLYVHLTIKRINIEEELLSQNRNYSIYSSTTKYKLIPFVF